MSFAIGTVAIVGGAIALAAAGTKYGMARSGRRKRIDEQNEAKAEMDRLKQEYADLDTSNLAANVRNPYADLTNQFANLENVYEDLTVNQQQAQFEQQMAQQQQANIMQQMGAAAGGSGIAALAQTMAQQGQLQAQRASASIGMQEGRIQQLQAGEAGRLQTLEAQGAAQTERLRAMGEQQAETTRLTGAEAARGLEWQKTGTMLGMEQQRLAAANEARARAKQQMMSAIGDVGNIGLALMGSKKAPATTNLGGGNTQQSMPTYPYQQPVQYRMQGPGPEDDPVTLAAGQRFGVSNEAQIQTIPNQSNYGWGSPLYKKKRKKK